MAANTYYIPCCGSDCAFGYMISVGDGYYTPNMIWNVYINDILLTSNAPSDGFGNTGARCSTLYGKCIGWSSCCQFNCSSSEYDTTLGRIIYYGCYENNYYYYYKKYATGGDHNTTNFPSYVPREQVNICQKGNCGCNVIKQSGTNVVKFSLQYPSVGFAQEAYGNTIFEITKINLLTNTAVATYSGWVAASWYSDTFPYNYVGFYWSSSGVSRVGISTSWTMNMPAGSLFD